MSRIPSYGRAAYIGKATIADRRTQQTILAMQGPLLFYLPGDAHSFFIYGSNTITSLSEAIPLFYNTCHAA